VVIACNAANYKNYSSFKEFTMNGLKMLIIGFLLGISIMLLLGATGSEKADCGFAVPSGGRAVIQSRSGSFYVLDSGFSLAQPITGP
jgi:hypothetical protein